MNDLSSRDAYIICGLLALSLFLSAASLFVKSVTKEEEHKNKHVAFVLATGGIAVLIFTFFFARYSERLYKPLDEIPPQAAGHLISNETSGQAGSRCQALHAMRDRLLQILGAVPRSGDMSACTSYEELLPATLAFEEF